MASNFEREPSDEVVQIISCLINAFVLPVMPPPGFTEADRIRSPRVSGLNTTKKRAMPPVIEPSHPCTSKTGRESHATGERECLTVERIENKETGMMGTPDTSGMMGMTGTFDTYANSFWDDEPGTPP